MPGNWRTVAPKAFFFFQMGGFMCVQSPPILAQKGGHFFQISPFCWQPRNVEVIVLGYHRFGALPGGKDTLAIQPEVFRRQMKALKESGITVISMKDFLSWRRGEREIPARSALITIDDGY